MPLVRKLISWLTYHPAPEEIARAFVTDYLAEFSAKGVRFSRLQNDGSMIILGDFGFEDSSLWTNRVIPSTEWRSRDTEPARILKGQSLEKWCNDSTVYVETLRDRGVTQGHLMVTFQKALSEADKNQAAERIRDLCIPLALYLSFLHHSASGVSGSTFPTDSRDTAAGHLSQRQILILRGMVDGKTNHDLAVELGFSVSTIRHETMRIYQALGVSDRKEAADKALRLTLI
jgi:DNA-binding CsgD family transcriptional regulator